MGDAGSGLDRGGELPEAVGRVRGDRVDRVVAVGAVVEFVLAVVGRARVAAPARRQPQPGVGALQALKDRFDPAGIMNPGKLLPAA